MRKNVNKVAFSGFSFSKGPSSSVKRQKLDSEAGLSNKSAMENNINGFSESDDSPGRTAQGTDKEEEDTLDAFMTTIDTEINEPTKTQAKPVAFDQDSDDDDPVTSYMKHVNEMKTNSAAVSSEKNVGLRDESSEEDEDKFKKSIDDLENVDHSSVEYQSFKRNFLPVSTEPGAILTAKRLRKEKGISIFCNQEDQVPKPITFFSDLGGYLGRALEEAVTSHGYIEPTNIQSQAIPTALAGFDIIGLAKTGSGKTASYILPMLVHVLDQPLVKRAEGPIGLILTPTRELAVQVVKETKKFGKSLKVRATLIVGGEPKFEQFKALRDGGFEIVVGTPGRIIDMIKMKACSFKRCTFVVLDEADRMFDLGFESQIRSILGQIRPDRQTLLFSATFRSNVEKLAASALRNPVRITTGHVGAANENITQVFEYFENRHKKLEWLTEHLPTFLQQGNVIIFVSTRADCAELTNDLRGAGFPTCSIHGETDQEDREGMMKMFRKSEVSLLCATDIAARGLDIKSVRTVINFEVAKNVDWHTHRIGRTGRAGESGVAFTLLTRRDARFASDLVRHLERSGQNVPAELQSVASMLSQGKIGDKDRVKFRKSR